MVNNGEIHGEYVVYLWWIHGNNGWWWMIFDD
jgi:hypothetical protein